MLRCAVACAWFVLCLGGIKSGGLPRRKLGLVRSQHARVICLLECERVLVSVNASLYVHVLRVCMCFDCTAKSLTVGYFILLCFELAFLVPSFSGPVVLIAALYILAP